MQAARDAAYGSPPGPVVALVEPVGEPVVEVVAEVALLPVEVGLPEVTETVPSPPNPPLPSSETLPSHPAAEKAWSEAASRVGRTIPARLPDVLGPIEGRVLQEVAQSSHPG